jgi:hypothetical protein
MADRAKPGGATDGAQPLAEIGSKGVHVTKVRALDAVGSLPVSSGMRQRLSEIQAIFRQTPNHDRR